MNNQDEKYKVDIGSMRWLRVLLRDTPLQSNYYLTLQLTTPEYI